MRLFGQLFCFWKERILPFGPNHPLRFLVNSLATLGLGLLGASAYGDAAALDYQPVPTGACRGSYVEPAWQPLSEANAADQGISVEADSGRYVEGGSTKFVGKVQISSAQQQLSASTVTYDDQTQTYQASGEVVVRQPGLLLTGASAEGSLSAGTAALKEASLLLHQSRLRVAAGQIARSEDGRLIIDNSKATTCEPQGNTWAIHSRSLTIYPSKGYGVAKGMALRVKGIPVAYFPYLHFPIDDTRYSGFLLPSIGQDSEGGLDLAIPWYFNLAPNYDLTYALRSVWKRGLGHEAIFRHLSKRTSNQLGGAYLPDDDAHGGGDRWLGYLQHSGSYGNWSSQLNYASLSDVDYLRDLGNPTLGRRVQKGTAGSAYAPALRRSGALAWRRQGWQARLELQSFQSLSRLQPNQYEILPRFSARWRGRLAKLEVDSVMQLTRFDQRASQGEAEPVTGNRYLLDTRAALPLRAAWGFFTPTVMLTHRSYDLEGAVTGRDSPEITTFRASLDAGLVFERETRLLGSPALQTLEPRLHLLYAEEDFQDDLPQFDTASLTPSYSQLFKNNRFSGYDRIGDAQRISIGLSSSLSSLKTGRHLLTANLGLATYLEDRQVRLADRQLRPKAEASPLFFSLAANFTPQLSTQLSYERDPDLSRSNRGFFSIKYRSDNKRLFSLLYANTNHEVQRDSQYQHFQNEEETRLSFFWPLTQSSAQGGAPRWHLVGSWNYGWDENKTIETLAGLEYNSCCWKLRLAFRRHLKDPRLVVSQAADGSPMTHFTQAGESGVFLEFQLKGLGSLGRRLDSLYEDTIFGYRAD